MATAPTPQQESEVALIITSRQPEEVVARIADLSSISGYQLAPRDSLEMRDLYFDSQDRAFGRLKLALRVREIGPERWLALKGPSRKTEWGGVERFEIEDLWSQRVLAKALKELAALGIEAPESEEPSADGHPWEVLTNLGFQVIQDRETCRQVRNILGKGDKAGQILAELVIDAVVYCLGDTNIRHHEVEIESKTEAGMRVISPVIDVLTTMFGDVLRVWDHSKLAIGFALAELLKRGNMEDLLDLTGNLKPAAYDKIDDYLRNRNS